MTRKKKIIHVITGLGSGGAEYMLLRLLKSLGHEYENVVVTLTDGGVVAKEIEEAGIELYSLNIKRKAFALFSAIRLARFIKRKKPDIVQTWMYHADLIGGIAAWMAGVRPLVWGVRQSNLSRTLNKRGTLFVVRLCAWLSGVLPSRIICCSDAVKEVHIKRGYRPDKIIVVENGFDVDRFKPNPQARRRLRNELHVLDGELLIGMVARFDPQKNHRDFLLAAGRLKNRYPQCRFVMCGGDVDHNNKELVSLIRRAGLNESVLLLGQRTDIPDLMAAMDILVSPSLGEGFPNAIGEAMATEVVCVVTDVGASSSLLGDCGIVLTGNAMQHIPESIEAAVERLILLSEQERRSLGKKARQRIINVYSLKAAADKYSELYYAVCH